MEIPTGVILPLNILSFILLAYQYYRINPDNRVLNLRFGLMLLAIMFAFVQILLPEPLLSVVLFLLALFWFALALYLFRYLPPRPET